MRTTSLLGTGIKLPYFVKIGDSADITLTPYLSPGTTTLETRYRQAFRTGDIQIDTAVSSEKGRPGMLRAYGFAVGDFNLPRDFKLRFDLKSTSDPSYLLDYGYSGSDRLISDIAVTRTRNDSHFNASLSGIRTLRGSELAIADQLPNILGSVVYEQRFFPGAIGGQGSWSLQFESFARSSGADRIGRDVTHLGGRLNWGKSLTFGPGLVGRFGAELAADFYRISQDSTYPATLALVTPAFEAELRWPWAKTSKNGVGMVLEPVLHLAWTRNIGANVPNEDSTLVEFDEGNLFAISRFPGEDRFETGLRATAGVKWTRYDPNGWSLGLGVGRVYRDSDPAQFSQASGLDGIRSDWLLAGQLKIDPGLALTARALLQENSDLTKTEMRLRWRRDKVSLASTYNWIIADTAENRPDLTSRLTLDARYRFRPNWTASMDYRYDFEAAAATKASFGLNYINECIRVDLSLSRRFTASTSVAPTTNVGLSLSLLGFGGQASGQAQSCTGL